MPRHTDGNRIVRAGNRQAYRPGGLAYRRATKNNRGNGSRTDPSCCSG